MTEHAYLPTTIISDQRSVFVSHVSKEVAEVIGVALRHATMKHAQMVVLLQRSHSSLKQALEIEIDERRSI